MRNSGLKNTFLLILVITVISGIIILGFYQTNLEKQYSVSVVLGESNTERWAVLLQGLEKASNDYNIQLNIYTITDVTNIEEQTALIRRELEKQLDAILICAANSKIVMEAIQSQNTRTQVVLLETDLNPTQIYPLVSADNYQMGYDMGKYISNSYEQHQRIGVTYSNAYTVSNKERLQGFQDAIEESEHCKIVWNSEIRDPIYQQNFERMSLDLNCLVALDCQSTENITNHAIEKDLGIKLFGVGNTETNIYYLDKGVITALLIPNEFNMGYLGLETAFLKITGKKVDDQIKVEHMIVEEETLYNEKTQRLVFPFVQ